MTDKTTLSDDVLTGAAEIAAHLGCSERRSYYMLERRIIPGFKLGRIWHMRRSTYLAFIEEREAQAAREKAA